MQLTVLKFVLVPEQLEDSHTLLEGPEHMQGGTTSSSNADKVMTPPLKLSRIDAALSPTVFRFREGPPSHIEHIDTPQANMIVPVNHLNDDDKSDATAMIISDTSDVDPQDPVHKSHDSDAALNARNADLVITNSDTEVLKSPKSKNPETMIPSPHLQNVLATNGHAVPKASFVPYESVISKFSSFQRRKNLQTATKPIGQGDMNRVNQEKPLCLWETQGGVCNNKDCTWQHFIDLEH